MAVEVLEKTQEEISEILEEAKQVSSELDESLTNIIVNVPKTSTKIIEAISFLFGKEYIKQDGSSAITYAMYKEINNTLRKLGKIKSGESV